MDRMSPLDASFLHVEDDVTPMHIASVAIFEGPAPAYEDLVAMVTGKLPLVPRYRQRVRFVPLEFGRPVWVDDPHFNIGYHIRHTGLPTPGNDDQLRNLVGRVMAQQLDRSKPLWEMWMVDGLEDGHWAVMSKTHHCMVDGVSGTDLLSVVMDTSPEPSAPVPDHWEPEPTPSNRELLVDAARDLFVSPYEQTRVFRARLRDGRNFIAEVTKGMRSLGRVASPMPESSLNGPVGPHRRWNWARSTLAEVKAVRAGLGGTVNDVVLTAITNGFRQLLLARGEPVDGRAVRSLVPVSVRAPGQTGVYNNQVSAMFAELPVGIENPVERLGAIRAQMDGLKESKQAVAGEVLASLTGFAPPMLLALGGRLGARLPQRNVNTVTTNVPGPQRPMYACGRQMLEAFPYVPLGGSIRIGIAIFSYNGNLTFGITGDYDTAPDLGVLTAGIEDGVAQLSKAAEAALAAGPQDAG
jgi:WS/DGAT/MGAT family acyltransferase